MPSIVKGFAGTFSGVYIGDQASSSVLTKVFSMRTEGVKLTDDTPTTFVHFLNTGVQSGPRTVKFTVKFLSDDDLIWKVARGVPLSGTIDDTVIQKARYSLLLVFPINNLARSFYFPDCYTANPLDTGAYKDKTTDLGIEFESIETDYTVNIMNKGTIAKLKPIMGSKSPF